MNSAFVIRQRLTGPDPGRRGAQRGAGHHSGWYLAGIPPRPSARRSLRRRASRS